MMEFGQAIFWLLLLMGLVLGGFFAVIFLRKRLKEDRPTSMAEAFTLGDLRQMLRNEQITQAEYDHLREQMVQEIKAKKDDPGPFPPNPKGQ